MARNSLEFHRTQPKVSFAIIASVTMVTFHLVLGAEAGPLYSITPPPVYTLFMGNLDINYTIPGNVSLPHAYVSLAFVGQDAKEQAPIARMGLLLGKKRGSLRVECGYLVKAGKYKLRMHMRMKGEVLAVAGLDVRWPQISLSLPEEHEAQTQNVDLWILSHATCAPFADRQYLQVKILRFRSTSEQNTTTIKDGEVVERRQYTSLTQIRTLMNLNCQTFDLDGSYQAVLVSTKSEDDHVIVSTSNVMHVSWSGQYQLSFQAKGLFPCSGNATVVYSHPPCSGNDLIRLYALHLKAAGSLASPMESSYITEKQADPAETKMAFKCSLFSQTASAFCFVYVSVSESSVYFEQTRLCVPAQPDSAFPIDGTWSAWSEWSACTQTCGPGKKNRLRLCNNPAPKHGGRFCPGDPFEWRPCSHNCTEPIPVNPLFSPPIDVTCACGCVIADVQGDIIATGRCQGSAIWTVQAQEGRIVSLTFGYFNLNYTLQKVTVRDGASMYDQLLFSSNDHGYPVKVVSSGATLRVELFTQFNHMRKENFSIEAKSPVHSHGFVAHYECKASGETKIVPVLYQYEEKTILGSTVTVVGIVLCVVVIVVAVVFVVLQRTFFHGKVKYTTTSVGGSPSHTDIPLTQSDSHLANQHSAQSRHSRRHSYPHSDPNVAVVNASPRSSSNASSPGDGIFVDMEKPLTAKSSKGDKSGPSAHRKHSKSSRTSSISSTCSQTVKFFKSSAGVGNSGPKSPKPPTKDYVSVKGPYGIEIVDTDVTPTHPKGKSPLSPRSYSHQKRSPTTPSSPATKKDLLLKKRYDRKSDQSQSSSHTSDLERIVTGSSDGSSSQRSKTSTTKAQVNWPQAGFVRAALNEVGKSFGDRNKKVNQRPPSEEIPLIDSNSQESPSHAINIMVKSDSSDSSARSCKARRPTSLTESYSSDISTTSKARPIATGQSSTPSDKSDFGTLKKIDTVRPRPSPTPSSSVTPTSRLQNVPSLPAPSPSTSRSPRVQRPSQQQVQQQQQQQDKNKSPCLSRTTVTRQDGVKDKGSEPATTEEREALLPKPDGQSPRFPRVETPILRARKAQNEHSSPGKLSKCSSRGSKTTISSPTRSINTPSEAEGLELEYDDFIEDDPLSYFDYEATQKLAFRGVERIGKTPIEEEEDEMSKT